MSPGRITLVASIAGATHASIWWVFTLVYTVVKSGNFTGFDMQGVDDVGLFDGALNHADPLSGCQLVEAVDR